VRVPVHSVPLKLAFPPASTTISVHLRQQVTPFERQNMSFLSGKPHFATQVFLSLHSFFPGSAGSSWKLWY